MSLPEQRGLLKMSYYTFYNRWEKLSLEGELETTVSEFDFAFPDTGIDFEQFERDLFRKAMTKANNVQAKAARLLGMSYKTFYNRWEKYQQEEATKS